MEWLVQLEAVQCPVGLDRGTGYSAVAEEPCRLTLALEGIAGTALAAAAAAVVVAAAARMDGVVGQVVREEPGPSGAAEGPSAGREAAHAAAAVAVAGVQDRSGFRRP